MQGLQHRRAIGAALFALCFVLAWTAHVGAAAGQTVVSLGFDDGYSSQYSARPILAAHGMHGTFFVISGSVGQSGYMTWPQIADLAADGNEIGGHTLQHPDLAQLDATEARRQICGDRNQLLSRGLQVADFAYPYGSLNAQAEEVARDCGYNSARSTSWFGPTCPNPCTESIPPRDPFATTVVAFSDQSLADLENAVIRAETTGGWAQIVIHAVCAGCAISPATLDAFLAWLEPRAATGTVVRTIRQVIGGAVKPVVPPPPPPDPPNGTNALSNPGLEQDANADGVPDCFSAGSFGSLSAAWTRTTDAHSGIFAERVDVSGYSSGDAKLIEVADAGACTPTVTPGRRYTVSAWYRSTVPVYFTAFARNSSYASNYWTGSPSFPASAGWARATWTTPVVPAGVNGMQVGVTVAGNGSMTVDDLGFDDAAPGDTAPPETSITGGPSGLTRIASPSFASASSEPADALFECRLDGPGSSVGAWGACSSPTAYASLVDGGYSFRVRATDAGGNVDPTPATRSFTLDTTAPAAPVISSPTDASWNASGTVVLSGSAEAGSAIELFDGTMSKGTAAVSGSGLWSKTLSAVPDGVRIYTAKATDPAGNTSGASAARTVKVDTAAPNTSVSTGPSGLSNGASPSFSFASTEPSEARFECRLDGPGAAVGAWAACSSPKAYAVLADGGYTFRVRAVDAAGNTDPAPASRGFSIDTTPPAVPVIGSPADGSWSTSAAVPVIGTAEPNSTLELFDGGLAKGTIAASATGAWSRTLTGLADGSRTFTATATDAAGNSSAATAPRTVRVDTAAPQTSITSSPSGMTSAASASLSFEGHDDAVSFACSIDGAPFAACTSPITLSSLAPGGHRFAVRASDAAGNTDATPASQAWSVDPSWSGPLTTTGRLAAGGTFASAPQGGLAAAITTPIAGQVDITTGGTSAAPPSGYEPVGAQLQITAPQATAVDPLVLTFRAAASLLLAGTVAPDIAVLGNGQLAADCTGAGALPDPCVASRVLTAGELAVVVRSAATGTWNLARLKTPIQPSLTTNEPQAVASSDPPPPPPRAAAPSPRRCVVPRLTGHSVAAARKRLVRAHCRVGKVRTQRRRARAGIVVVQNRRAGLRLPAGAKVDLTVGRR